MLDTGAWSDQITSDIVLAIGGFRRFGCRWLGHRGGSGTVTGHRGGGRGGVRVRVEGGEAAAVRVGGGGPEVEFRAHGMLRVGDDLRAAWPGGLPAGGWWPGFSQQMTETGEEEV